MSLPAWLRFAELTLLAGWLVWRIYRPALPTPAAAGGGLGQGPSYGRSVRVRMATAGPPGLAVLLVVAQFVWEAQATTDPFTPLLQVLPVLLRSTYGGLSVAAAVLGLGLALRSWRGPATVLTTACAAVLLAVAGAASVTSGEAVSAAASTGEIAMSATLMVPRSAVTTPNPYANDGDSPNRGRDIYQQYCLACHGLNGDGNGPAVAGLRVRPPTFRNPQHYLAPGMDGAHYWVIQHGDGVPNGMPAWQGTLTAQQTWDVLDYVKSLAGGTSRQ